MTNTNYPSATPPSQPSSPNRGNRNLLIGILAAALLGTWGYLLYDKNKSGETLQVAQTQSDNYMSQRDSLKILYDDAEMRLDSITGANNTLQGDKTALQKQIEDEFHARKNNVDAANLPSASELANLRAQLDALREELAALQGETPLMQVNVDSQAIAEVVANWTGIPVGKMVSSVLCTQL